MTGQGLRSSRGEEFHSMISLIARYVNWLHTRWPAGTVEKLPVIDEQGGTSVPGVRIVGDLTGIPLLKFSSNTGARAVRAILQDPDSQPGKVSDPQALDLAIIGGGVSCISAMCARQCVTRALT